MIVDPREITALAAEAAARTRISAWQYEKDYFATLVLSALADELDGAILFKGGTSLSKAYGLIDRFSEDLDLLVLTDGPGAAAEEVMERMREIAATCHPSLTAQTRVDTHVFGVSRSIDVRFPATHKRDAGARSRILLEPGVQGGPMPQERRCVTAMVAAAVPDVAGEVPVCDVDVLHPARTLIEKLLIATAMGARLANDPAAQLRGREARHLYDIYRLLEPGGPAKTWLSENGSFAEIARECAAVTARYYPEQSRGPEVGDISQSPLFVNADLSDRIGTALERTCGELCHPGSDIPEWEDVVVRVQESRQLLS